MDGQSVFSYSHKRSLKAKTLASSKNVIVSADCSIDPALLFQRFLVVSQTGDLRLDDVMSYELCPYRTQIFLFSCSSMQMFLNVLHSISALTRRNPMSIISRLLSRYNMLCKKVARATMFVTLERLPPTASACKFHSLRTYYQVMKWRHLSGDRR